jgi:cytochrome c-type biogenesis protein CcmH/NrfF
VLILAYGVLPGFAAGATFVEDAATAPWVNAHALVWAVPIVGVVLVIAVATWLQRRRRGGTR